LSIVARTVADTATTVGGVDNGLIRLLVRRSKDRRWSSDNARKNEDDVRLVIGMYVCRVTVVERRTDWEQNSQFAVASRIKNTCKIYSQ
jgi:hypothetical protein